MAEKITVYCPFYDDKICESGCANFEGNRRNILNGAHTLKISPATLGKQLASDIRRRVTARVLRYLVPDEAKMCNANEIQ